MKKFFKCIGIMTLFIFVSIIFGQDPKPIEIAIVSYLVVDKMY